MAFPFSDIMHVRFARVLIMRVILRSFMRRMCSIMRGSFSPSRALPTYYAHASARAMAHVLNMRAFMRNIMRGVRWIMGDSLWAGIDTKIIS